jgi:hypothetical protein
MCWSKIRIIWWIRRRSCQYWRMVQQVVQVVQVIHHQQVHHKEIQEEHYRNEHLEFSGGGGGGASAVGSSFIFRPPNSPGSPGGAGAQQIVFQVQQ